MQPYFLLLKSLFLKQTEHICRYKCQSTREYTCLVLGLIGSSITEAIPSSTFWSSGSKIKQCNITTWSASLYHRLHYQNHCNHHRKHDHLKHLHELEFGLAGVCVPSQSPYVPHAWVLPEARQRTSFLLSSCLSPSTLTLTDQNWAGACFRVDCWLHPPPHHRHHDHQHHNLHSIPWWTKNEQPA